MILSMKEVTYRRQGKNILENISWEFEKGQTWAILGLNGAGKSTLLRILTAEFWKSSGDLTVLGVQFGKGDIPNLRTKIGIVGSFLAERFPTDLLAEQIVLTGKYKSSILYREYGQKELNEAIDMLTSIDGAHLVSRTYASLSQGERQLLLIARSLMESPELLILDEATSSLDAENERLVQAAIEKLMEGRTVMVIAHRLTTVQNADQVGARLGFGPARPPGRWHTGPP